MRRLAKFPTVFAAIVAAQTANGGAWTTDASVGIAGEYSTNPALILASGAAETRGAILLDAPTVYSEDSTKFVVDPSFRVSNSPGYTSIASDYAHITAQFELDSAVNTFRAIGGAYRDSSLLYNYLFNGSTGVRHDTALAELTWTRQLMELLNLSFDSSTSHVKYGKASGAATLTDYRYSSAGPALNWAVDERTTLTVNGAVGLYEALNGTTQSVNSNLTIGLKRRIDELWTLTGNVGYSRESNRIKEFFGPFFLGTARTDQNGAVYTSSLVREGTQLKLTASASRSLTPSGLAFLSRTDSYGVSANYTLSPLWAFVANAHLGKARDSQPTGSSVDRDYRDFDISAVRTLSEYWALTLSVSRITEKYASPAVSVAETGASVQLNRKFNTIEWH